MACTKTAHACTCTLDGEHRGRHACICGQKWMGKTLPDADEHGALMELKQVADEAGERITADMEDHGRICRRLRDVFGLTHHGAHTAMTSFTISCAASAAANDMSYEEFMEDMDETTEALLLGSIVGAMMANSGRVITVDVDDDDDQR